MAKTKLKDLEVTEVSLVDAGANQHAHVALYKRNGGKPEEQPTGQNPEQAPAKSGLHKFFSAIGKALKLDQADVDSAVADIEKADTFNDKMEERKLRRITDEIWDVCFALENSLCSIIRDEEVTDKAALMNQSIDEFDVAIKGLVTSWGAGKTAQIVKTAGAVSVEHISSYPGAKGYNVSAGRAKITIANGSGKAHPWHLVYENWSETHVYGWVDDGSFD